MSNEKKATQIKEQLESKIQHQYKPEGVKIHFDADATFVKSQTFKKIILDYFSKPQFDVEVIQNSGYAGVSFIITVKKLL